MTMCIYMYTLYYIYIYVYSIRVYIYICTDRTFREREREAKRKPGIPKCASEFEEDKPPPVLWLSVLGLSPPLAFESKPLRRAKQIAWREVGCETPKALAHKCPFGFEIDGLPRQMA